jgi:hypothetical protein
LLSILLSLLVLPAVSSRTEPASIAAARHPVPREHPYLLGSREELRALARERAGDYQRMLRVVRDEKADDYSWMMSASLAAAIEGDTALAKRVQQRAMKFVNGPIRAGHVPFATDLALCGLAYDLCHEAWPEADRSRFNEYLNRTVDANVQSETHVFHNGWYGYKSWGIGVACYASYHENPRAPAMLRALEDDYRTRAALALEWAGDGGGWAEGYYIHYWLYEWLFFCEVARRCEGVDYHAVAPRFYANRAIASMFETYPGLREYGSRRCVPMGDGGGRMFGGDRDKALSARRILVNRYRDRPDHQAVHAFNETTPRSSVGHYAYKDFLWRDASVPRGALKSFRLSHVSPGPGYVYARSSWGDDATYFFFKCGDRFTAHQHLDANHFVIYRHEELAGDGGHYDDFGSPHDVNYHLRTIAHSTMLILDPAERWRTDIRAGKVAGNDGGQTHAWPHHNGATADVADWQRQRDRCDIADLLAFEDRVRYLYVAGDGTRAYSTNKLKHFTRQVVYLRPATFVIFDRVRATQPKFKKTWLLQAMRTPTESGKHLVVANGKGRLFVQTLLPRRPEVRLASGDDLYQYGGLSFPPRRNTGPAPECRVEISPSRPSAGDLFLHVLTAVDAGTASVPSAQVNLREHSVEVLLGETRIEFQTDTVGGDISLDGRRNRLAGSVDRSDAK